MTSGNEPPGASFRARKPDGIDVSPRESIPDVALMLRVRDDDEPAFAELYRRYHRRVQDFFYGLSRNGTMASDLAQETFLRVWKLRKKYAATGSFPAYLFTFGRNIWLEKCREFRKLQRLGSAQSLDDSAEFLPADAAWRPDEQARRHELESIIFSALDELPDEQRMAFVMRTIDGVSLEDVASAMQCPTNTVRSRRILAIKKLRETLRSVFVQEQAF
jgi:RNA polymerase sigma-70 factor (ECF subfamily)